MLAVQRHESQIKEKIILSDVAQFNSELRHLSLPITPSEVKSPLRAVKKRPERAVPDIFLSVG